MSTVTLGQAKIELELDQLILALQSLTSDERRMVREALDEDWTKELDAMLASVHARFQADPMSDAEIPAEVEARRLISLLRQHSVCVESVSDSAWSRDSKDDVFINLPLSPAPPRSGTYAHVLRGLHGPHTARR